MESALWQVYRKGEAMHFHELATSAQEEWGEEKSASSPHSSRRLRRHACTR